MFFLGWLAFCFLVVGAINLYLRHFGLPKGRGGQAAAGRVGGGYDVRSTGFGSITFSGLGAKVGGSPFSGSSSVGGETGHWINCILSWIYQTQSRVPDFVESWLKALTTEADKQAKEMQVRFEGIHGSPPEFSHFRTEPASTERDFTILMTVTLRDVTLQTSTMAKSTATKATQPVKCDVYLQSLTGQVKAVAKFDNNELCLHLSFISEPNTRLQIRPTRVDYVIDNSAFDKVVRGAISNATMNVDWTSRSTTTTSRPSNLRITEPNSVQRFTNDHQVSGQTLRTPPSKSPPLHATFRDDNYNNDDQRPSSSSSSAVASRSFTSAASPGHNTTQERQSPLSQSQQTSSTFQGQQPHLQQQGQYQGHGQYPEVAQGQQYPGTSAQGQGQYQSTSQGQQYPGTSTQGQGQYQSTSQGQQYPGPGQGQQYPNAGQGQQYPSAGQGQQYPGPGQGQQYPSAGQGQGQYPSTGQGQQYPNAGQGQQYPSAGQGQQYPGPGQGQQYPSTGQGQQYPSMLQGQQSGIASGQTSPQSLSQGPKLLIKVVKANGLIDTDFGECSAFCRVHVDNPPQDFTTNVIRNTVNPYWDEQFISDLHTDTRTKQIHFEVFDRDRQPGNDLLGKAVVLVDEIRRMPSSRQIIPLTGKPKSRTSTSGSVTVEFVFRESLDSSPSLSSASTVGSSPHHPFGPSQQQGSSSAAAAAAAPFQKQTSVQGTSFSSSAQYTPVTGSGVNEQRGRKDDKSRSASAEYSTYPGRSGSASGVPASGTTQLSAHNLALTSSQAGSRSHESPTVVVTGAESLQPSRPASGTLEANSNLDAKKKESFASTLKRKLARVKIKPRSQSADRATSHSMREGSLLRPPPPPGHAGSTLQATPSQSARNTDFPSDAAAGCAVGTVGDDGTLRKARSNSFSSSLRRIFRRDKGKDSMSRDSSLRNPSSSSSGHLLVQGGRGGDGSREALTAPTEAGYDRSRRRQNTPDPSGDRFATGGGGGAGTDFTYSSSVPAATSPLNNR